MDKIVDHTYIPKYIPKNLKWYEQVGLMTWYDQGKSDDFLKDLDSHFQKLLIVNFYIFNSKTNFSATKLKEY